MFDTHKLNEKGFQEVKALKSVMAEAYYKIINLLPEGREKAIFNTKLEEALFFATKAVASKPDNHTEVVKYTTF